MFGVVTMTDRRELEIFLDELLSEFKITSKQVSYFLVIQSTQTDEK